MHVWPLRLGGGGIQREEKENDLTVATGCKSQESEKRYSKMSL